MSIVRISILVVSLMVSGACAVLCSAANIETFYSYSTFQDALGSGSFSTESFSGNQVNTPGLGVTTCSYAGPMSYCAPAIGPGAGTFLDTTFTIANDQASAQIGHVDGVDWTTTFNLPNSVYAVGMDIVETPSASYAPGSTLAVALDSTTVYPFGGVAGLNAPFPGFPNPSYDYAGFVGFLSDTPFDSLILEAPVGGEIPIESVDNLTFGDPVPEPATLGLAALALLGVAAGQWARRCHGSAGE